MRHRDQQERWHDAENRRNSKSEFTLTTEKSDTSEGRCALLFNFYKRQLNLRPHVTNGLVSLMLAFMADFAAQNIEHQWQARPLPFDIRRSRALALTSSLYNGLVLTSWLQMLSRIIPGTGLKPSVVKLMCTQTILQPFGYVPFFFVVHGLLLMQSSLEILAQFERDYFALLVRLWSLFMPTRLVMFLFVPVQYQVLWDSSVAFLWNCLLSLSHVGGGADHNLCTGSLVSGMLIKESFGYLQARQPHVAFLPVDKPVVYDNSTMT
mmetsp:Transcript_43373/g.85968  ORF Transcript_43373/g.85968 Transcript_43373/m.85968 type:complete len:265 (-) Transcript_43373:32-826(-)